MKDIVKSAMQETDKTPIEVLLDIDENGMTTAKKLYYFLELDPKNYSRWCNANILKNKFAEVNKDYEVFFQEDENPQGGRPTPDYKLTAEFAKQLSMLSKTERGEQARQYFLACEKGLKIAMKHISNTQSISNDLLKSIEEMNRQTIQTQQNLVAQLTALTTLITASLPKPYKPQYTRWISRMLQKIDTIGSALNLTRKQTLHKLYTELQDTYDIDLNEYQYEYCYAHNLEDTGLYTMNTIEANLQLKKTFEFLVDTYTGNNFSILPNTNNYNTTNCVSR